MLSKAFDLFVNLRCQ